jgi:cation diffusion facilitator CzcD-associated flavoprotein CzcO
MTAVARPPAPISSPTPADDAPRPPHTRIAILGSGFAGLGLAIRLLQSGEQDFLVLERGTEVGGTWRDNTYPGCACDVPSHLYSFSFAPNPDWSRTFSPQPEIQAYLRRCAQDFGVLPHLRFEHEVRDARWDDAAQRWHLDTAGGPLTAQFLVAAQGALSEPSLPDIQGIQGFQGRAFHSARWDHSLDLRGTRVAVVGTGASAIQIVPKVQPLVDTLVLFQRTPPWIMPHRDRPIRGWERALYRSLPAAQKAMRAGIYWGRESFVLGFMGGAMPLAERIARRHLRTQVPDPELRAKLKPLYRMGCKRILISNEYYPALTRPNVEVVSQGIRAVTPHGVVSEDGVEHQVDVIVFGTGFKVTDMPIADRVHGREGLRLADAWEGSPEAYLGTTVAGFPNLFLMTGPNTGLGHTSMVLMVESQTNYILDALRLMRRGGLGAVEPRRDAQERFNDEVQRRLAKTVWNTGGCKSWYLDSKGRNTTLWPGTTWSFRRRTRRFQPGEHLLRPAVPTRVNA